MFYFTCNHGHILKTYRIQLSFESNVLAIRHVICCRMVLRRTRTSMFFSHFHMLCFSWWIKFCVNQKQMTVSRHNINCIYETAQDFETHRLSTEFTSSYVTVRRFTPETTRTETVMHMSRGRAISKYQQALLQKSYGTRIVKLLFIHV